MKVGFRQGLLEGWFRVSVGFVLGSMYSWFGVWFRVVSRCIGVYLGLVLGLALGFCRISSRFVLGAIWG